MTHPAQPTTGDEREIRDVIAGWAQAVRDQDLATIRANHDADILLFDVPQPLLTRGLEAYAASWQQFFAWSVKPIAFEFSDLEVTAGSDVAFATAIGRCAGMERSGERIQLQFRLTVGLRKADGRWRIVHEHHSIPAEP